MFTSLEKFDGVEQRPLTPAEIKQIAGRAGRFGSKYESGLVTCLNQARTALRHWRTHWIPVPPHFQQHTQHILAVRWTACCCFRP